MGETLHIAKHYMKMWSIFVDITEQVLELGPDGLVSTLFQGRIGQCVDCGGEGWPILHSHFSLLFPKADDSSRYLECKSFQGMRASLASTLFSTKVCLLPSKNVGGKLSCSLQSNCLCVEDNLRGHLPPCARWQYCPNLPLRHHQAFLCLNPGSPGFYGY